MTNRAMSKLMSAFMLAVFVVTQAVAVSGAPELPDPGNPSMTRDQQIQLGQQAAAEVYKQMPVLPDSSPETQYIRQLGQRLVAQIPPQHSWPYEFHTIPQKEINAFALPGGQMFVNVGTITAAADEAQLVGVMAHEMSHVYMQHSAKQAEKASLTQGLAGLAGAILGAKGGVLGSLAQAGVQVGATGLLLKYSRADEAQADAVGAIIMYKAGYNPQELANFFKTLEAQGGGGPQFLSDHPNPGNREAAIKQEVAPWPPKNYSGDSQQFARAKQQAATVQVYSAQQISDGAKSGQWASLNQRSGAVFHGPAGVTNASATTTTPASPPTPATVSLSSVLPSSKLVTVSLGPMSIARPDNWQAFAPKQQGGSVTIAPPAGVSGDAVGYGVVIGAEAAPSGKGLSLDQLTSALVQQMEQSSSGDTKALGNAQKITVAGVQGRSILMESTSPFAAANGQQQKESDWLVTVPTQNGKVIYLVFVAPHSDFARFRPTFNNMLKSVKF